MDRIKIILLYLGKEICGWTLTLKIGTSAIGIILMLGVFAPWLTPYDPFFQDYTADNYNDQGTKELLVIHTGEAWKIKEETWTPKAR